MRRRLAAVAAVAAAGAAVAVPVLANSGAASAAKAKASASTINILSIGDVSGPTKIYGSLHYAGVLAAVNYINSHGGLNGSKLAVTHLDSGGNATTAVSLAIHALAGNSSKYAFVDAGAEGTENDALIPIMKKYGVFAITLDDTGVCATASNCPNEFVVKGNPGDPAVAAAAYFKKKGLTKVGVLEESIAFTEGETPGIVAALKADGITPTVVTFPATAVDLTPEMSQLKSDGVQGVFAEALGPPAGYTLAGRAKLSWSVPVMFDVAASSLDITKLAPASQTANAFLNVYRCQNANLASPGLKTLLANVPSSYKATLGTQACDIPGNGWDGVLEFANAAKQAKSTKVSALVKAMLNLNPSAQRDPLYTTSVVKKYTASDHDDVGEKPSDFVVIPVSPVSGAQDHPPAGA